MYHGRNASKKHDVAHNWAHEVVSQYKKDTVANSLFYEGKTIYSYGYHFPIAVLHKDAKCGNVTFFTTRTYSNTTAKHISEVRGACSHHEIIFCRNPDEAAKGYHENNLLSFENAAKSEAENLHNSRKPEKYLNNIASQREKAQKYAAYFKIKLTAKKYPFLFIESKDGGNKASAAELKRRDRDRKAKEKKAMELFEIQLHCFRSFETREGKYYEGIDGVHNPKDSNAAYLRYNKKTKRIETSKGVQIPAEAGKRFYKWLKSIKETGCDGECSQKIVGYEVSYVNATEFKVGCHTVQMEEADKMAKRLKW